MKRDYLFGAIPFWQARIAAILGDRDDAVSLLEQALDEGHGYDEALHFNVDLRSLQGYAPFETLLRPRG